MSEQGLERWDVESLRPHYARTLWQWVDRLEANRAAALAAVGEKVYRIWRIYMAGSAHAFERGWMSIYQVLAGKPLPNGALGAARHARLHLCGLAGCALRRRRVCSSLAHARWPRPRRRAPWGLFDSEFDEEKKPWTEIEAQLPAVPQDREPDLRSRRAPRRRTASTSMRLRCRSARTASCATRWSSRPPAARPT